MDPPGGGVIHDHSRGVAATGQMVGDLPSRVLSGWLNANGTRVSIPHITVEFVRLGGGRGEAFALLLHDIEADAVPVGSVISGDPT